MKTILLLSALLINTQLHARSVIGKIILLRGQVTALYPGELEAVKVKKNMPIKEDTSLLSQEKSFAQVQLKDGSKLILGPNSKMVVNYPKESKTGIINLLKGKVRSQVDKGRKKNQEIKQVIQTKTAALGVRGTEFQATYNPESRMTSLVTYQGKVAMVKKDEYIANKLNKTKKLKIKSNAIDQIFKKADVLVEPGSYSAVSENLKKATAPVNLNPKQFSILKVNKTFSEDTDNISEKEIAKEEEQIKKIMAKRAKETKRNANKTFNIKTGSYKPKDGGYIDLETGIYIPPSSKSKLNAKLGIYEDKDAENKIDKDGNFKTPDGVKLDPKKGFIAINKKAVKKAKELNKEIAGQIKEPRKPTFEELDGKIDEDEAYDRFFNDK